MNRDERKNPAIDAPESRRFIRARRLHPASGPPAHAPQLISSESAAVAAGTRSSPLATLLAGHVLRDGETVLLVLKPSLWFIAFQSMLFAAVVLLSLLIARGFADRLMLIHRSVYIEAATLVVAGRVMWAVLQWMGRLYVLTDQRIIRMAGVFSVDLYDCPLRKIARADVTSTMKEQLFRVGSIEIYPKDSVQSASAGLAGNWQTIARPIEVHEQIVAAIRRSQNGS